MPEVSGAQPDLGDVKHARSGYKEAASTIPRLNLALSLPPGGIDGSDIISRGKIERGLACHVKIIFGDPPLVGEHATARGPRNGSAMPFFCTL